MKILDDVKQHEIDDLIRYIHKNWRKHGNVPDGMSEEAIGEYLMPRLNIGMYGMRHRLYIMVSLGYLKKVKSFTGRNAYILTDKAKERLKEIENEETTE